VNKLLNCAVCATGLNPKAQYNYRYRSQLCDVCGKKLMRLQPVVYAHYNKPLVRYSDKYGFSIKYSFFRIRVYDIFRRYKEKHNLLSLVKSAITFNIKGIDMYCKSFVEKELDISYKIFFDDEDK